MRILAFAYACEPTRGSEPGAGCAWTRMLARLGQTWVIPGRDYRASIEEAVPSVPKRQNLKFVHVELDERFRSWQRGLRIYYLMWQIAALKEAPRWRRSVRFDLVWHLMLANAWYGSMAALAGRPFVYGPVGGCEGRALHSLLAGPADMCVADPGGAGAVVARLADVVLLLAEQRRRGEADPVSTDSLLVDRRAGALRELLSHALS
jgi:hypothetical protein